MTPANNHKTVVTLTGPSGSGKTVLSKLLQDRGFKVLVSVTTRAPREGEVEGEDYHFIDKEKFKSLLDENKLIEYTEYNGTMYGVTSFEAEQAFEQGKHAVVVVEPHGKEQMKDICKSLGWPMIRVFVDNDENLLYSRLLQRLLMDVSEGAKKDPSHKSINKALVGFADINPKDQSAVTDLLSTFLVDNGVTLDVIHNNKKLEAAAKRLSSFRFEQDEWVLPARLDDNKKLYEHVFPRFDQHTQSAVVEKLVELANNPPASNNNQRPSP